VRIATRRSALALAQARHVASLLPGEHELVEIVTTGDRHRDVDDKREWVLELEQALLDRRADLAVHSAKDVPAVLAEGTVLAAAPERADPRDVLCGAASLDALADGARVGTASLRRAAQLRAQRPDLDVVELRGNVDTRLRKLAGGEADAIVLAAAGLERLGRAEEAGAVLDLVPAAGQGTLALQARAGDRRTLAAVEAINDTTTFATLVCERAVVAGLDADCRTPVGVHARVADERLLVRAFVGREDGSAWVVDELAGDDPEALGKEIAHRLLTAGAQEILGR
jgi:hydroxymethylbilane synthase